jgi:hypothetical protein
MLYCIGQKFQAEFDIPLLQSTLADTLPALETFLDLREEISARFLHLQTQTPEEEEAEFQKAIIEEQNLYDDVVAFGL